MLLLLFSKNLIAYLRFFTQSVNLVLEFVIHITKILVSGCVEIPDRLSGESDSSENFTSHAPVFGDDVLYQVSTINALLQGVYDGVIPIGELETHGDFGIGTFDGLEGEMLALDGNYYQIKTDGIAYPVSENMTTPFA